MGQPITSFEQLEVYQLSCELDLRIFEEFIDGLRKEISAAESSRSEAADRLKDSESISRTRPGPAARALWIEVKTPVA